MGRGRGLDSTELARRSDLKSMAQEVRAAWNQLVAENKVTLPASGLEEEITPEAQAVIDKIERMGEAVHNAAQKQFSGFLANASARKTTQEIQRYQDRIAALEEEKIQAKVAINSTRILVEKAEAVSVESQLDKIEDINDEINFLSEKLSHAQNDLSPYMRASYLKTLRKLRQFGEPVITPNNLPKELQTAFAEIHKQFPADWLIRVKDQHLHIAIQENMPDHRLGTYTTSHDHNFIDLNPQSTPDEMKATLAHELAHHLNAHNPSLRLICYAYAQYRKIYIDGAFRHKQTLKTYGSRTIGIIPETEIAAVAAAGLSYYDAQGWDDWYLDSDYRNFYLGLLSSL